MGNWVILLHGMGRTHRSMKPMARYLQRAGFRTFCASYPATEYVIEALAATYIPKALENCGAENAAPIHFVTHSLGGLLVRSYLQSETLPHGSRIVMLAPPNQGTELVDKFRTWRIFKRLTGLAGQQLGTDPDSLPRQLRPISHEVGVIAGNRPIEPWFARMLPGPNDGRISLKRTRLTEMKDFLLVKTSHPLIMYNRTVMAVTARFLKYGTFSKTGIAA